VKALSQKENQRNSKGGIRYQRDAKTEEEISLGKELSFG